MMSLKIKVYDGVKYNDGTEKVAETIYNNVEKFEVKRITD